MQQFQTPSYIHEYLIMEMKSYEFKFDVYTYKYIYICIIYTYIYKSINRYDKDKGGRRERDR